jgi:hypothetical protein
VKHYCPGHDYFGLYVNARLNCFFADQKCRQNAFFRTKIFVHAKNIKYIYFWLVFIVTTAGSHNALETLAGITCNSSRQEPLAGILHKSYRKEGQTGHCGHAAMATRLFLKNAWHFKYIFREF